MELNLEKMNVALELKGSVIDGRAAYYAHLYNGADDYLIILIPHTKDGVERLVREIESKN